MGAAEALRAGSCLELVGRSQACSCLPAGRAASLCGLGQVWLPLVFNRHPIESACVPACLIDCLSNDWLSAAVAPPLQPINLWPRTIIHKLQLPSIAAIATAALRSCAASCAKWRTCLGRRRASGTRPWLSWLWCCGSRWAPAFGAMLQGLSAASRHSESCCASDQGTRAPRAVHTHLKAATLR